MKYLWLFTFLLLEVSCEKAPYFQQSLEIPQSQWKYDDLKDFSIDITDIDQYYDLVLDVNHATDYSYENIYVKIHTTFPSGEEVSDEVSFQLADDLDQWEGTCKNEICNVSILLRNRIYFDEVGIHKISIEQFNRVDPLEGINKLTMKLILLE